MHQSTGRELYVVPATRYVYSTGEQYDVKYQDVLSCGILRINKLHSKNKVSIVARMLEVLGRITDCQDSKQVLKSHFVRSAPATAQ
ncbi:hypothetical protein APHCR_0510 [Anaplasma phagocytophilum str. CR1007]|nr:hypothetical protein APHCR_0510 [Anaplasma phagocytophilum str. CR1007]